MNNKSKVFLISTILCGVLSLKANSSTLNNILSKYCVPTVGNCDKKATYNTSGNYCDCGNKDKFYNLSTRICENCIFGSFASDNYKTCEPIRCPTGYVATLIIDGKCPYGYRLTQIYTPNTFWNGTELKTYNFSKKTFN